MEILDLVKMFHEDGLIKIRNRQNSPNNNGFSDEILKLKKKLCKQTESISKIVYDFEHPNLLHNCVICNKNTSFKNYIEGYRRFCSSSCSCKLKVGIGSRPEQSKILKDIYSSDRGKLIKERISNSYNIYLNSEKGKSNNIIQSKRIKDKILNGSWTPSITNSWTHWSTVIDGKKFRSSFEEIVYLYYNKDIEYEKLRVPYIFNNKNYIYIVDFIDNINKLVFEIKPKCLIQNEKNIVKDLYLTKWAIDNKYKYKILSEIEIREMALSLRGNIFVEQIIKKYKR